MPASKPAASKPTKPVDDDPFIGTHIGGSATAVGTESGVYAVDPETGDVTHRID